MSTTVKNKIRSGTVFLFGLLLVLGGVSIFHIVRLQNDSRIILKNNYESLDYAHQMMAALDSLPGSLIDFDSALQHQERNITEKGEQDITKQVRNGFNKLKSGDTSEVVRRTIRSHLQSILVMNMHAIESKNKRANTTANTAVTYITLISAIIFIVSLTFTYNFPLIITEPINALTQGISQIASKNYSHRIHLRRNDEFGQMANSFNDMAERLEFFENSNLNRIIFEKTRAEAVIDSLKDASIGIDKGGTILFANDEALQLLGLKSTDIVGELVDTVKLKNDLFLFLLEEKSSMPFKIIVEGRENYFVKETIDIKRDDSAGKVIVLKNITSFKELDVAKNNFIATISHELKTPLASSDFSLKLLQDNRVGSLTSEQLQLVENLKTDNRRMLKILSELLNISQVEAGKIQLNVREVPAVSIGDEAIEAVLNAAAEKDIQVEKVYANDAGLVLADPDKTNWVLKNFLTNAIKYSPRNGRVEVGISRKAEGVQFTVTDSGPGIAPEYHAKVFERFFRIPGSEFNGTGLGLAISKEFIEAEGGRIWVESDFKTGSTFCFVLPQGNQ